jgi:acyl-CoA thioesterase-2
VIAVQHGQQIFNLAASFQAPEEGFEHQAKMPEAPPPEGLRDEWAEELERLKAAGEAEVDWMDKVRPIEIRNVDPRNEGPNPPKREPQQRLWFRSRTRVGDDPRLNQVVMAYASDMSLLGTAVRPHGVSWQTPGFQSASLDHAMWFHHPTNFERWHLYVQDSPSASGGRGFNRGAIYREDGVLVASAAQEGLMRMRKAKP